MKKPHIKTKKISIYLLDENGKEKDDAIVYAGSAWTLSVEENGVQIYKNGQCASYHPFGNIINVVENG